jgi:hypothetical protein
MLALTRDPRALQHFFFVGDPAPSPLHKRFDFAVSGSGDGSPHWFVAGPIWSLLVACAVLPLLRTEVAIRRLRRARRSKCIHCGYDLRATPERCPECGTSAQRHVAVGLNISARPAGTGP